MRRIYLLLMMCGWAAAELPTIPVVATSGAEPLDPASAVWKTVPPVRIALNRTPPLYSTDAPAAAEIPAVQLQILRDGQKAVLRLEWKDASRDAATLPAAKNTWQSETTLVHSEATNRFFDACAVMIPARPDASGIFPSLQMGDADHPVILYYYDVTRGAAVMEGSGRGATRRTGKTFPARAAYSGDAWQVTMELDAFAAGTPLSVAIWNGRQQDRDGRKYFSVWHKTR